MNILFAASEAVPFIKTGGLADVIGSLPRYIDKKKYDCRVILPKYLCMDKKVLSRAKFLGSIELDLAWREQYVGVYEKKVDGVIYYLIDNEYYFSGPAPYSDMGYDAEKFAFFSKAVLACLPLIGFKPDIIHCNDWQTGLIPVFLCEMFSKDGFYKGIKTIMTIHNLKFQGFCDKQKMMDITGLNPGYFMPDKLEAYGCANLLKGGLVYSDCITTVSKSYAEEIRMPYYGEGLDGLLTARKDELFGILNGIDYDEYDPVTDKYISANFDVLSFRTEKVKNKHDLQNELGLEKDDKKFVLGIVSRLTGQKGLDLVECVIEQICSEDTQLVVLGTGEDKYEDLFRYYENKYKGRVCANIMYSEERAHKIYAGCDAFLMPSLFEPCGLSQLIALRYGTVPIVRETGGLRDTVEPYDEYRHQGTGFSFANYNAHEMLAIIEYAKRVFFNHRRSWNNIVERGMGKDFSWNASVREYEDLYDRLAAGEIRR